jgi:trans-aconitate 2-methyltransferase
MTAPPPAQVPPGRYAYGDDGVAIERLLLLAEIFEPATREFVASLPVDDPEVVLDLGCGPGATTALLAERFPEARTVGLDASSAMIETARTGLGDRASLAVADVSSGRLPGAPADVIYARLLLAHLPRPLDVVAAWTAQLRPGGVVALDEVERIVTDDLISREYLGAGHGTASRPRHGAVRRPDARDDDASWRL